MHISGSDVITNNSITLPDVVSLDLSTVGSIPAGSKQIDLGAAHNLATGDTVNYDNGSSASIDGLIDGNDYYVIVDEYSFSTEDDGIDVDADTIDLKDVHGYASNEAVVYHSGGGNIDGLVDGQTYYLVSVKEDNFFNASGAVNSTDDTINMGIDHGIATGDALVYEFSSGIAISGLVDGSTYYATINANTFDAEDVDVAGDTNPNTVDLGSEHGFTNNEEVIYSSGGGTAIGGLVDGQRYFLTVTTDRVAFSSSIGGSAIVLSDLEESGAWHTLTSTSKIKLAESRDAAVAGQVIDIDLVGATGTHNLLSATRVQLAATAGGAAIDLDLTNAEGSRHSITLADRFALAATLADALAGKAIELDASTTTGAHTFTQSNLVEISAISDAISWALTIAGSVSAAGGAGGGFAAAGASANSVNTIDNSVTAEIDSGSVVTSTGDAKLVMSAEDDSLIMANAGGGAFAGAGGAAGGGAIAIGASSAVNTIANSVTSRIANSTVSINGDITLRADETATIWALTIAGAGAIAGGAGGGLAGSGAAAFSVNTVSNNVESSITTGSSVTTSGGGTLSLSSRDSSLIMANAGGVAFAGAGGAGGGGALSVGASLAVNTISNTVKAFITGSTIVADGDMTISADSTATIWSLTIAGAIAGAGGAGGGLIGSGAAASSVNTIANTIEASIGTGSDVTTTNGGGIDINAADSSLIMANAGGAAFAGGGGAGGGAAVAIGASLAVNTIANVVDAFIAGSTIETTGSISIDADSMATIWALTIAGAISGAGGGGGGLAGSGAASISINTVANKARAGIKNSSNVTTL
ncbi:MAG: hypothetical protein JKY66_05500, partial [Spongiibacteraceae bacterium]|nr:hypothetical protein [Spongiibacteraceae bacterium]